MNQKLNQILRNVTVEPAVLFYFTTYMIMDAVNTNLFIQKICRENITMEPSDLNTPCKNTTLASDFVSKMNSKYRAIMMLICIIYSMFATCWSDEAGKRRRPLIFVPMIAQFFHCLVGCLHSHFWLWHPKNAALTELIVESLGGGIPLMTVAVQMYICDVSNSENRTMRLGFLYAVELLCFPLGKGSAGFIIRAFGYFYSYLLCAVLSATGFLLAVIFVKDVSVPVVSNRSYIWRVVNLAGVRDSFGVIFKKSMGSRRMVVAVLILIKILMYFITQGEKTVFYLFMVEKFKWNEVDFSVFSFYKYSGVILGTVFCSILMSKILKIHDGLIGAFAVFWDTITAIGFLFATQNWHIYAVALFDVLHGTALSVCISFISKHYDSTEFGRLSTVQNAFAIFIPLCHPVYNGVFQMTIKSFPSAFFIISIILNILVFLLYSSSYLISKKIENRIGKS
ncbi:uncharacterized protein LOC135838933 [Planococcus citri]|uniref:uncharacterized protein LOC135838933 n=1 Tax=Planococcus citri TaxID=170843 RepID=UPI0031F95D38